MADDRTDLPSFHDNRQPNEGGDGPAAIESPTAHSAAVLVDWQIDAAVRDSALITEAYEGSSSRYATYEVHASDLIEALDHSDGSTVHVRKRIRDGKIWIKPKKTLKVYTTEVINLQDDMYATVTGLGQLYACGLTIGSTYIDPGSRGAIYLAVSNISDHEVCIQVGSPIARVQFWRLSDVPTTKHPGHQARRRIELDVRLPDPGKPDSQEPGIILEKLAAASLRSARLEAALVIQTFIVLGLFWYANPTIFDGILRFAAGDDLPPVAHFLVPALLGPSLFFAARWAWSLVRSSTNRPGV